MTALKVSGLVKSYGEATALQGADLTLESGSIHALVGENGAGKSTLVKVLAGLVTPDAGEVLLNDAPIKLGSPRASREAGIKTAFQELSLLPHLTVAENLLIAELPSSAGLVRSRKVEARAAEIFERWGVSDIDPRMPSSRLPLSAQQRLEIVRALHHEPRILILDEPTAALPDTTWLFKHVRDAAARGAAVLYISHKLAEIEELCTEGSVMRNGTMVGTFIREEFDHDAVISQMIGRSIQVAFPPRPRPLEKNAPVMLRATSVRVEPQLQDVSLHIREGEILGVAGLEGQGQRELFYALAGADTATDGEVEVGGKAANLRTPRTALRSGPGIALVPEERKREGIFADLTSVKNISVPKLRRISRWGLIRRRAEFKMARNAARANYLREEFLSKNIGQLSGGNQQKAILSRTTLSGARVLLMFDPTRGIDPGAKLEVYRTLREAADSGSAVLLYSTEIPELIGMSDRIVVLYGGRIVAELTGSAMEEARVMAAAVGRTERPVSALSDIATSSPETSLNQEGSNR